MSSVPIVVRDARETGGAITLLAMTPAAAEFLGAAIAQMTPWSVHGATSDALANYLALNEPTAPRFTIMAGDAMAGAVGMRFNWLRGPYLQLLAILPDFQNRGIGHAIMAWIEMSARARGDHNLWVAASDFNSGAVNFYRRHGYVEVAALDGLVSPGRNELLLRNKLHYRLAQ